MWTTNGEILVNLVLSQVTVLDDVSGNQVTLIDSDDVEVYILELGRCLQVFTVCFSLIIVILKLSCKFVTNIKANSSESSFASKELIIFIIARINDFYIVTDIVNQRCKIVTILIKTMEEQSWIGILRILNQRSV